MILIAEDNPLMKKLLRGIIDDLDALIVECADGEEAFRICERHSPDWVLMDVSMPIMDGLTATRQIVSRCPSAKVVIITNHDDEATRAQAFEAGACGFLGKDDLSPLRPLISNFQGDQVCPQGSSA
jgi:DNA-binding NarL/FixJ family response regulator